MLYLQPRHSNSFRRPVSMAHQVLCRSDAGTEMERTVRRADSKVPDPAGPGIESTESS